jgi:hypothetical protein
MKLYYICNMEKEKDFTFENGLDIQHAQLLRWKNILKESMFDRLQAQIDKENQSTRCAIVDTDVDNGYEVFRGNDIDNWVANNLMGLIEEEPRTGWTYNTLSYFAGRTYPILEVMAVDLRCPNCGDNLGKDKENTVDAH